MPRTIYRPIDRVSRIEAVRNQKGALVTVGDRVSLPVWQDGKRRRQRGTVRSFGITNALYMPFTAEVEMEDGGWDSPSVNDLRVLKGR